MKEKNTKKAKNILILLLCFVLATGIALLTVKLIDKNGKSDKAPIGAWWWNDDLDTEKYLNFAIANGVGEIYYCTGDFDDKTEAFISKANSENIDVYWLAGEYEWLEDHTGLLENIDEYIAYQSRYPDSQFSGIHLDIEPHQSPELETDRYRLIYSLIDLANTLNKTYPTIKFDYDLPFWLHDEITYNGLTKPAYEHMINAANRVYIMSYRDTADAILDISKEEIAYAKQQNKQLVLCVETSYSSEGDKVSFWEEGKDAMQEEINKLRQEIPNSFGISIHHIKAWYELKN